MRLPIGGGVAAVVWTVYNTTPIPAAAAAVAISFALMILVSLFGPQSHPARMPAAKKES